MNLFNKRAFIKISLLLALIILSSSYLLYIEEHGNFHVVTKGQFYRSAQLDKDELVHYIKRYRIKSILNLRGKEENARWYREEIKISQKMGVIHYDFGISATRELDKKRLNKVLDILLKAPRPILVHCQAGSDRSGLISAVWEYAIEGKSAKKASKQLSLRYLHFPYLGSRTKAMDKSFRRFVKEYKN